MSCHKPKDVTLNQTSCDVCCDGLGADGSICKSDDSHSCSSPPNSLPPALFTVTVMSQIESAITLPVVIDANAMKVSYCVVLWIQYIPRCNLRLLQCSFTVTHTVCSPDAFCKRLIRVNLNLSYGPKNLLRFHCSVYLHLQKNISCIFCANKGVSCWPAGALPCSTTLCPH